MIIRDETPADIDAINSVTIRAFETAEHTDHNEHLIVKALRENKALTLSLVAEEQGNIVGHVAVSPITISTGEQNWFGLGPVSVDPNQQQLGIGSKLIRQALRALQDQGASGCVVLGEPSYYSRFGFKPHKNLILQGVPAEYFQAIAFDGQSVSGEVNYDPAFYVSP